MARTSRIDQHRDKIIQLLDNGWTPAQLGKKYGLTYQGMRAWIIRHGLKDRIGGQVKPAPTPPKRKPILPVQTSFGIIYMAPAERLPPMPPEREPAPGKCHRCGRRPIGKGKAKLCDMCFRLPVDTPMGAEAPVTGTTAAL